jgi:putative acetyltransferase
MKIRRSTEGDAAELARLHRGTIRHVNSSDYSPAQIKAWAGRTSAAKFRRHHQTHIRFVATEQGKIIGFADFGKDGSFGGLYVHKDFVGQGVGTKLIKKLEEMGKKSGVKVFEFLSTKTAKHFYERKGYLCLGKKMYRVGDQKLLVYKMRKTLAQNQ